MNTFLWVTVCLIAHTFARYQVWIIFHEYEYFSMSTSTFPRVPVWLWVLNFWKVSKYEYFSMSMSTFPYSYEYFSTILSIQTFVWVQVRVQVLMQDTKYEYFSIRTSKNVNTSTFRVQVWTHLMSTTTLPDTLYSCFFTSTSCSLL